MVLHFIFPNPNGPYQAYPRRQDRQFQEPNARNAQGLFPPDACVFVGKHVPLSVFLAIIWILTSISLAIGINPETLARDVQEKFSSIGRCHVKIKLDKRNLPGAFVQFEKVEDADTALAWGENIKLHNRWLRIERARGKRTACFGSRDGAPVTQDHVSMALGWQGPIEACGFEHALNQFGMWTIICKVTFAFVDDFKDAVKAFKKNPVYYLIPLDIEGSPLVPRPYRQPPYYNNSNDPSTRRRRTKEIADLMRDKGHTRVPLPAELQPKTGHTVEEYVRKEAHSRGYDQDEQLLLDVIQDLENEQRAKHLREEWSTPSSDNSTARTPSASMYSSGSAFDSFSTDVQISEAGPQTQPQPEYLESTIDHLLSGDSSTAGLPRSTSTIRSRSRSKSI
ncbi:uncharacterized protein ACLA_034180 [Aspergillus clavatus NRRL 1]|uniref:RRM domain-containing protein n=1 Tax=Aspergillus clavatus (strain ATCC 1007 / CBS 513.65 / DSM 816 / NCTC 3887 / NRRL 1 / QM 1276 / 107) TaxID=344612 RepID=A1CJ91_ASPCL|nr:uncharacterized protein ACLA_034180 [Aspergillus clavatus NRRL 1]EAW09215.1 hypothetical protein ACLA_034180 [Aspergillus clavatus NRRL 1]